MAADSVRRSAARTAAFVAVPVAVAVLLVSALAFNGFGTQAPAPVATGPVTMTARELPPDVAAVCRAVIADLPETAAGHSRRPVTAGAEQNAAYGDPPLTLECGTPYPTVEPTAEVFNLVPPDADGGVCWYPVDGDNATVWTTVDRQVAVTVTVPGPRAAAGQAVTPFLVPIGTNVQVRDSFPTGCTSTVATPAT